MTLNISIQKVIRSYIESGFTAPDIYKKLNKTVSRSTVNRWYTHISHGEILAQTIPGRSRIVRKVCTNKKNKSANKIARELGSNKTARKVIRKGK